MLLKIRNTVFGLVAVAIAAATFIYLYDPTANNSGRDETIVTLKVIFDPPVRQAPVVILARINADDVIPSQPVTESPWVDTGVAFRGDTITLVASQPVHGPLLTCTIIMQGKTYGPIPSTPGRNGISSCLVSVVV